jgi:hypothetical protein
MTILGWQEGIAPQLLVTSVVRQYFGRCDTAHSLACSIGPRGGNAARSFLTAGKASIVSRQRQNAGYFGYMTFASGAKLNP